MRFLQTPYKKYRKSTDILRQTACFICYRKILCPMKLSHNAAAYSLEPPFTANFKIRSTVRAVLTVLIVLVRLITVSYIIIQFMSMLFRKKDIFFYGLYINCNKDMYVLGVKCLSKNGINGFKLVTAVVLCFFVVVGLLLFTAVFSLREETRQAEKLAANPEITVLRTADNTVETIKLEEFLVGVVAGEMPVTFETEALKAQAVAARSYILKRLPSPYGEGLTVHTGNAAVCDDYAHCQAYVDEEQRKKNWGENFAVNERKIRQAVEATANLVLVYDGVVVSPTFCSTCGGNTEAAGDYWQSDVPALQAVACYWDTEAPKYLSNVYYTKAEMAAKLGISTADLANLKIARTSDTGRVTLVTCGEKQWKGSAVRTALGLNSTDFQWLADENGYRISVKGFGHGVGLCQHGANGMAKAGADYRQILHHYYTDVDITEITQMVNTEQTNTE